jgi:peptidoglycan/xylan/chitin deacetylase (PgdA/CDA1 family)
MKKRKPYILFFLIAVYLFGSVLKAQTTVGTIANWDYNKKAAVILTFDDWTAGQYPIAVKELKSRNLNATFFIPTTGTGGDINQPINWGDILVTLENGNEIANHSQTHPRLNKLSALSLSDEIRGSKKIIETNIISCRVTTYAYPFGTLNQTIIDSIKASGHIGARGVFPASGNYTYNFAPTFNDYYKVLTFSMYTNSKMPDYVTQIQNVIAGGGLLTFLYHALFSANFPDKGYAPIEQAEFQKQLDTLTTYKNNVWITTFSQALKYHQEKNCAKLIQIKGPSKKQWVLNLTDTLSNNSLYNQPLFLQLKTNGQKYAEIVQNKQQIKIDYQENDTIMFHAIPDGGEIILKPFLTK